MSIWVRTLFEKQQTRSIVEKDINTLHAVIKSHVGSFSYYVTTRVIIKYISMKHPNKSNWEVRVKTKTSFNLGDDIS